MLEEKKLSLKKARTTLGPEMLCAVASLLITFCLLKYFSEPSSLVDKYPTIFMTA